MTYRVRLCFLIILFATAVFQARASETSQIAMRTAFLQAERYIDQGRDADYAALADTLKSYPLYPYLHYQWLKKHLDDDSAIQSFLHEYASTRYAPLLNRLWLQKLGQKQQWPMFISHYRKSKDVELQCYYALAQYQNRQTQAALEAAKQLWLSGHEQPASCDALFTILKSSPVFSSELVWQRFQLALTENRDNLAAQLIGLLPEPDRASAELWLKAHRRPQLVGEPGQLKPDSPYAGRIFAHAIARWLDKDPKSALMVWDGSKQYYAIPDDIAADTERRLALGLAFRGDSRAYDRLSGLLKQDNTTREWRVRAALNQQHWKNAAAAIAALSEDEKNQDKWQYWLARSLAASGSNHQADPIFQRLALNRSFYGFLAADRLHQDIALDDKPVNVSQQEIDDLTQQNEFQAVAELLALTRKSEAKLQWWHAVANFDHHRLTVAAKLAQQWQWPSTAIFTIAKANEWGDVDLRFPLHYFLEIQDSAKAYQLDPALIYGLIRQESAFDELADSPAGAKGLMQIMPKTGEQIAENLKEHWSHETKLFNPDINIKYGSFYYQKLLQRFNQHYLLATAAYNAGANRIKNWLPETKPLPGDIWIESIPYKETRGYVSSVLMYAMIYQHRLHRNTLKPQELLRDVPPG